MALSFLILCATLSIITITLIFIINYCMRRINVSGRINLKNSHFLITGGSKGIGKALALNLIPYGSKITIVARGENELKEAFKQLETKVSDKNKIFYAILDVTADKDMINSTVKKISEKMGPIDVLINCAGKSIPATIDEVNTDSMRDLYEINVIGGIKMTQAVIPSMKQRKSGQIVFISSVAGQFGVYGFSAYSASKFALRGIAECLAMELKPFNIGITIAFPPDTDTPGFAEENLIKSEITKKISEYGGLVKSDEVATAIIRGIHKRQFSVCIKLDGWITTILTEGCSPPTSLIFSIYHFFCSGIFRVVFLFYLVIFNNIVENNLSKKLPSKTKS